MAGEPAFKPGELEEALALTHVLFESLPSQTAEATLRACLRLRWPHLGREHLLHVLQIALAQAQWRQ